AIQIVDDRQQIQNEAGLSELEQITLFLLDTPAEIDEVRLAPLPAPEVLLRGPPGRGKLLSERVQRLFAAIRGCCAGGRAHAPGRWVRAWSVFLLLVHRPLLVHRLLLFHRLTYLPCL